MHQTDYRQAWSRSGRAPRILRRLVVAFQLPPWNGLRISKDGPVDLDAVTRLENGIEPDQAAENTDFLSFEVDVGKLPEDSRTFDTFGDGRRFRHLDIHPQLLAGFGIGNADLHPVPLGP